MQGMKFQVAAALLLAAGVLGVAACQTLAEGREKRVQPVAAPAQPTQPGEDGKKEKGAGTSVKELPPVVVRTVPQAGDTRVDAAKVTEIRATFSKEMADKSWSWAQISEESFPKITGDIRYDKDRRTCVLPVKLQPGKTYVLWLNSEKFDNFKDKDGHAAVPYLLVFQTRP
jgi:RNA polymerase sigma-70 factor (ECF subfamily)